jgi:hypothetical protein
VANGSGSWLVGVGGAIAGTVLGGLILRGLGLAVLQERMKALEEGQDDLRARLARVETILLERAKH